MRVLSSKKTKGKKTMASERKWNPVALPAPTGAPDERRWKPVVPTDRGDREQPLPLTELVKYPDGSTNVEINKIASIVDLNKRHNKHLDFNSPAGYTGFTTVDYEGNRTVYVATPQSGYGNSVILRYPKEGRATYAVGELFSEEWVDSLRASPLTIGVRHGRFNHEKLVSVAGLRSMGDRMDGSNPLVVAVRVFEQESKSAK